jgi:hypothetical protein
MGQGNYRELQSAYLYNFAKYIRWPEESKVFIIGIYGEAEISKDLQRLMQNKKIGGKPIEVREVKTIEEISTCHIVYLSESNSTSIHAVRTAIDQKSILLVTEQDLIKKGASISFIVEEDHLRFKLKRSNLLHAGLVAAEGLLQLAILL